uniref:Uncharacterized protein n=2 Tax=Aureimonas frigidaquae TaxID=424757 RepID=A0A0P0Z2M6_9HYPH|nr:hypothetical protein [Aureimonas frigidaquae]
MLIPPLEDIALAAIAVGLLFLVRCLLTIRRIRTELLDRPPFWSDAAAVGRAGAYGPAAEPDRRHAMRQLIFGVVVLSCGLAIAAFLIVTSVLTPFVQRGMTV